MDAVLRPYPLLLAAGFTVAAAAGDLAARRSGLDPLRVWLAEMAVIAAGVVGTRLLHRRLVPPGGGPAAAAWRRGGAVFAGALPAGICASLVAAPALGLPFAAFWDVAALALLAGLPVARLGCLAHGCCCGRPWRFGLPLPGRRGEIRRRVPTQLLEGAGALLSLAVALPLAAHRPFPGAVFLFALAAYAAVRVALEPLREQERPRIARVQAAIYGTVAVLCAVALAVGSALA